MHPHTLRVDWSHFLGFEVFFVACAAPQIVWTPGAVFSLGWLLYFGPIALTLILWFWMRKHIQPIKARRPGLVLVTDFLLFLYIVILCLQRIAGDSYPCLLNIWSSYLGVLLLFNTYLWRCWSLYYLHHQTQQLLTNATRDAKDRHFDYPRTIRWALAVTSHPNSNRTMARFMVVMTTVLVFPCLVLTIEQPDLRSQTGDGCDFAWGFDLVAAYVVMYSLVFAWFAWTLRSVIDGFQIKEELKATAGIAILTLVPWWLFNNTFDRINEEEFPFSTLFLILGCCAALFVSTAMPLWYSIWGRPLLEGITPPDDLSTLQGVLSFPEVRSLCVWIWIGGLWFLAGMGIGLCRRLSLLCHTNIFVLLNEFVHCFVF